MAITTQTGIRYPYILAWKPDLGSWILDIQVMADATAGDLHDAHQRKAALSCTATCSVVHRVYILQLPSITWTRRIVKSDLTRSNCTHVLTEAAVRIPRQLEVTIENAGVDPVRSQTMLHTSWLFNQDVCSMVRDLTESTSAFCTVTSSWRGILTAASVNTWVLLGLVKSDLTILLVQVIEDSCKIYSTH